MNGSASRQDPHLSRRDTGPPPVQNAQASASGALLSVEELDDVVVIRPLGRLNRTAIAMLRRAVAEASAAVIVDLDECVLVDPGPLIRFRFRADEDREICVVSGRLTCRRLLARAGIAAHFAVFARREDALQARLLAAEGYGPGWAPH